MNKLKQLYKAFLTKWNDNTLYKTSLTRKSTLFRTECVMVLFSSIGLVEILISNWIGIALCYITTTGASLMLAAVYKEVAVGAQDTEEETNV